MLTAKDTRHGESVQITFSASTHSSEREKVDDPLITSDGAIELLEGAMSRLTAVYVVQILMLAWLYKTC